MNVKRFTGRNSREAMQKVRQAFGENAVVLSTKPCEGGIEVLAMAPESVEAIEMYRESDVARLPAPTAAPAPSTGRTAASRQQLRESLDRRAEPAAATPVQEDVSKLAMSTLSFQD